MTKATDSPKGTGDVEITPEMIEAGVRVYEEWEAENVFQDDFATPVDCKRKLVGTIFRNMGLVRAGHVSA